MTARDYGTIYGEREQNSSFCAKTFDSHLEVSTAYTP